MYNVMGEIIRLLIIGTLGVIVSIFNILDKYANVLIGCIVGVVTIVFLIFQIVKLNKEIKLKNIELCEKRAKVNSKNKDNE